MTMWRSKLLPLAVMLNVISPVHPSCLQIELPKCHCQHPTAKRYIMDCQSKGFGDVPSKVNRSLANDDVIGNFSHNSIEDIPDFYFLYMKHYDVLDFSSNKISKIGKNTFNGLQLKLTTLNLSRNRLSGVPVEALKQYIRLNRLDLSWNQISSPCGIFTADVITYSLASNRIATLEDQCFAESTEVQELNLAGNKISSITSKAFKGMGSLKSLDLGNNALSSLRNGLNSLIELDTFQYLSLRGNSLKYLGSICDFPIPKIKKIDFGYNRLVEIRQYCFSGYTVLRVSTPTLFLNFEHNEITALAGSVFSGLKDRLEQLQLNNNKISKVNVNTFTELEKLLILNLDDNRITDLEFLRNWKDNALQDLSVARNQISKLSPGVFKKMMKLTKLTLDGNLLLNIQSAAFQGMHVLSELSIQYNLLTNLADGAFAELGQLKKLSLSGNALVTLKNCTFANLNRLIQFHFEDNLLHCDCDLLWILKFNAAIKARGGVPDKSTPSPKPVLEDQCHYPVATYGTYMDNTVSQKCQTQGLPSNACFGLEVKTYEDVVDGALNVTWNWNVDKANSNLDKIWLRQIDIETDTVVYNATITAAPKPLTLPVVEDAKIYKICVTVLLDNGNKEMDCTVWPRMIKKPTTTVAPTTTEMSPQTGLSHGDVAAICLGIILIIIIILLVLFAIYLWKTQKYRQLMYTPTTNADSDHGSTDRSPASSNGKSDPMDFRVASEDDPMMIGHPTRPYEEHDL